MNARYYRHSGNFEPIGLILMLAFGVVGAVGGAFVYGYATHYIPLVIVTLFLTFGYAVILGVLVGMGAKLGKVRNMPLLVAFSAFAGVTAVYAQWVVFLHLKLPSELGWQTAPSEIQTWMSVMAATGIWEVFDWTPTGGALYAFWGVEAAIIAGGALVVPWATVSDMAFCEKTGEWAEDEEFTAPMEVPDDLDGLRIALEGDAARTLEQIPYLDELEDQFLRAKVVYVADEPDTTYFLTVEVVSLGVDDDGDLQESCEAVVQNLIIDQATADLVLGDD